MIALNDKLYTIFCNNNNNPAYKHKRSCLYTSFILHNALLLKTKFLHRCKDHIFHPGYL